MTEAAYSSANWNQPPHNRHSFQHMSALFATQTIQRSTKSAMAFEYALEDTSQLTYPVSKGATEPLQHFLDSTFTDAFLVLKEGVIVTEEYRNNMQDNTQHLLNSVSKSFVGMLAGIAVEDGLLDTSKYVSAYLPELANSAFSETTVQRALDMTAAVAYSEDYDQPKDDFWHEAAVVGWRPDLQSDSSPRSLIDYCKERSQTEQGEGERFHYRTVLTNLCTAVIERATNTPFCEFFAQRLWQPLGPEQDANVVVDPTGLPSQRVGCVIRDWEMTNCANYLRPATITACYPMVTTRIRYGQTANPTKSCASAFTAKPSTSTAASSWSASNSRPTRIQQILGSGVRLIGRYAL